MLVHTGWYVPSDEEPSLEVGFRISFVLEDGRQGKQGRSFQAP
jgi:hypothetical protein